MNIQKISIALLILFLMVGAAVMYFSAGCKDEVIDELKGRKIEQRMKKYALTPMYFDASAYSPEEKELLKTLIEAGKLADEIFWGQTYYDNLRLRNQIVSTRNEDDPVRKFFFMQAGPYDRLADNEPFLDVPPKPPTAGFYPPDMTREEFEQCCDKHPEDKDVFLSPYTLIKRQGNKMVAIPYHKAYEGLVGAMAQRLQHASNLTNDENLGKVLRSRANALLLDDYYQADVDWIEMKRGKFDLIIGPIEVYEDALNNLKAAYMASIGIVDEEASAKLDIYADHVADLENFLPYPDKYKNKELDLKTTFVVVQDIYRGGLMRSGFQYVAESLPNDPAILTKIGGKKTFWKNALDARMNEIIAPIGNRLVAEDQLENMTKQGYFHFVQLHEIAHGLGPHYVHGTTTPVNVALRDLYSWIEENKADIAGLHSLRYFREHGVIDPNMKNQHLVSYLASLFRTMRFGTGEGHGKAAIVSLNFFLEKGAITYDQETMRYAVDFDLFDTAVASLANELLMIEVLGDYDRAKKLEAQYSGTPDFVRASLESLKDLPIDFVPQYEIHWE